MDGGWTQIRQVRTVNFRLGSVWVDVTMLAKRNKKGSVYFLTAMEMQGVKYGGSEFQWKSSKRRWACRRRKERVQREERKQCEEQ